ncbi:MAG: coproporphyrinogen III oxidase [Myxococcota bacterium]|nr:coproporphyrinogen III oxidase [Myxococcota bacterium]
MAATSEPERRSRARALVEGLQARHVGRREAFSRGAGSPTTFQAVSWNRDGGRHGGGTRLQTAGGAFDRASVNVSCVHYDDVPERALSSATALSAIAHPAHPRAPSLHLHVSWTARKDGQAYWRIMADLNPSIPDPRQTERFRAAVAAAAGDRWAQGRDNGDRYFHIPALERHRGVCHFYLEGLDSGDFEADRSLGEAVETAVIDTYATLITEAVDAAGPPTEADRAAQLAYHTVYLFQVLTMDRGTTSGLLVHGDNDVGILGSLPSRVDRALLASWRHRVPTVQAPLVDALAAALAPGPRSPVDDPTKRRLAAAVRAHYRAHPDALALQARGDVLPPTVANHQPR